MSRLLELMGAVAFGAGVCLLWVSFAYAQEATRLLTIADCPRGYVLGVENTNEPQPITRAPTAEGANPDKTALDDSAAPRRFVTGCVPRQAPQNEFQPQQDQFQPQQDQ